MFTQKSDRRGLGWLAAATLSFLVSFPAWGLDLDHEIQRQNGDAAQILNTLGRDKRVGAMTKSKSTSQVQVKLIRKAKPSKRR